MVRKTRKQIAKMQKKKPKWRWKSKSRNKRERYAVTICTILESDWRISSSVRKLMYEHVFRVKFCDLALVSAAFHFAELSKELVALNGSLCCSLYFVCVCVFSSILLSNGNSCCLWCWCHHCCCGWYYYVFLLLHCCGCLWKWEKENNNNNKINLFSHPTPHVEFVILV